MNAARTCNRYLAAAGLVILAVQSSAGTGTRQTPRPAESRLSQTARAHLNSGYGKLPLAFEPNQGQTDARARFLARGGGMTAFFTDSGTVMVLSRGERRDPKAMPRERREPAKVEQAVVRMKLEKAAKPRHVAGVEKLPGVSNYFIGNDPKKWRTDVPHYARIEYEGVYPGIDLVWYGNQRQLEYDFVVAPGAEPKQIQVAYEGVESVDVGADGELVLRTALGEVRQRQPRVYQEIGGKRVEVGARYALAARNRVSFQLAQYDRKRELRIDPVVLVYSTYLGGDDEGYGIAVDGAGSAYITGFTYSVNFPTQSPYQATLQGTYNVFVTKLTPAGNALVYSTYLGGSGEDEGYGIAVDGSGSAYVTGYTTSTNFPTQSAYQTTLQGSQDAFVTKLSPAGSALVYSTYQGGSGSDWGSGIAVDGAGSAYVTGYTNSTNFPTQSPYQATFQGGEYDAFVTKLTPAGNALLYSTYLGGSGIDQAYGVAVDGVGSAYVTGRTESTDFPTRSAYQATCQGNYDAFVTKLTPAGNALVYSTYLGGSDYDGGEGIAVDGAGSAYIAGYTGSTNFPTQSPYQAINHSNTNVFVTKLTPAGSALVYSTYLGGSGEDYAWGIAVDGAGSAYVTGATWSADFPTQSAYQATSLGDWDGAAFVTKFTPAGSALVYSTYLGGSFVVQGAGIAVDTLGSAYVAGHTQSTNFPTQSPYQATLQGEQSAFVTKLTLAGSGPGLAFFPISPCRLVDTRVGQGKTGAFGPPSLAAFSSRDFPLLSAGCSIPSTAQAYSLNFTVVPSGPLGFLSAWPTGDSYPGVSTLNSSDGSVIANAAIVPAGSSGSITVMAANPTDLVIDINGYFAPADASGLDFFPLTPCRMADTRTSQPFAGAFGPPSLSAWVKRDFPLAESPCLSASGQAYSLNMTVVPQGPLGFLSAWPVGLSYPGVSTLNSPDGAVLANAALVPAGSNGGIDVLASNNTDLIIDLNGMFAAPGTGGLQFYAVRPCRVADTRSSQPFTDAFGPPSLAAYSKRDFPIALSPCGIPSTAQAYALNLTVVPQGPLSYLSTWPAGQSYPGVSTLNSPNGGVVANAAIVPAGGEGAITVLAANPTDLIIDAVGYFAP
jgi:hypothetical protein